MLIEANDFFGRVCELERNANKCFPDYKRGIQAVKNLIANAPVVDAAPIVHGEWIKEKCQGDYGRCSECECRIKWIPQNYKYCPTCGAKMGFKFVSKLDT